MAYDAKKRVNRFKGLYDIPTDGISKKVFDRYKDQQVRHRVAWQERIRILEKIVEELQQLFPAEEEE